MARHLLPSMRLVSALVCRPHRLRAAAFACREPRQAAGHIKPLTALSDEGGQQRDPEILGCPSPQRRSELWTGTIGARRAWTVSMISALSMPCR
jgi:hypothetical protein